MKKHIISLLSISAIILAAAPAFAQDGPKPLKTKIVSQDENFNDIDIEDIEARHGLDGLLSLSANISFTQNINVIGQQDGFSTILGLGFKGGLDWINGRHEIRNTLTIDMAAARTPVLAKFVKTNDLVTLSSQYNYFFLNWMGAFARLGFETSILPNSDHRSESTDYVITKLDGTLNTTNKGVNKLKISGAFQPFAMAQSIGVIADPVRMNEINLTARVGLGARETFSKGVLSNKDDKNTPTVEYIELDNIYQFGLEAFIGATGSFKDGLITYDAGLTGLFPFVTNDAQKRNMGQLARLGLTATINFNLFSWMGIQYKALVLRDKQLAEDVQFQQALLATFNYTFIKRNNTPEATAEDKEIAKAEQEKAAAEKRAQEAEARAKAAEERAKTVEANAASEKAQAAEKRAQEAEARAKAAEERAKQPAPPAAPAPAPTPAQ